MASRWLRLVLLSIRRSSTILGERPVLCNSAVPSSTQIKPSVQDTFIKPISAPNVSSEDSASNTKAPSKEKLLRIDWMVEKLTPEILKSRLTPFFEICKPDVVFEDRLYNYKLNQRGQLHSHIAKIRMYYRYLSPYNRVERIGSCIYEGEDVIVLLWRLTTLESNFWSYLPTFLTKQEPKLLTVEGALDIHVTPEGEVYKLVNRKITAADREGARVMAKIKEAQEDIQKKQEEKHLKELGEAYVEEQKRQGRL